MSEILEWLQIQTWGTSLRGPATVYLLEEDWGEKKPWATKHTKIQLGVCAYEHLNGDGCDSTLHIHKVILICHNDEQYASDTNSPVLWKLWFKKKEEEIFCYLLKNNKGHWKKVKMKEKD